tara:strand:- start:373 stop:867 length:495 start_codon:yes stop_codon:yes gene_type:complete
MKIDKKQLKVFLEDANNNYSLENCFENSSYNPNGYSAQQDYNRFIKSMAVVRKKGNEMRDDLAVAIDKSRGDFDELANTRVETLSMAVAIQDQNLDKLEMRLEMWKELRKARPDLELKIKTAVEVAQDLAKYLAKRAVTEKAKQDTAVAKRKTLDALKAQTTYR